MLKKAFGILRLQKIIFNCILQRMENAEEILSILNSDIKKYGRKDVFHYEKSRVRFGCFTEKINIYVERNDGTEMACLSLSAQTFSDNKRSVYINDNLHGGHLLDFAFYMLDFTLYSRYNKHLSCFEIFKTKESTFQMTEPLKLSEHSEDVPETASSDEPETEDSAPAEKSEQSDDVPETASAEMSSYPLDVPFDMRIRNLCRKCKHLESCFEKDRSEVLEPIDYKHCKCCECGVDCSLCCYRFKNIPNEISSITNIEEILSDGDLPF